MSASDLLEPAPHSRAAVASSRSYARQAAMEISAGCGDTGTVPVARVEAVAIALYEHSRDPDYSEPEWDWPNIDKSYDKDDEDETDPEWLRNRFRAQARAAIAAIEQADSDEAAGVER